MNREQAKELLPFIQAFAEGRAIQQTDGYDWYDLDDPDFMASGSSYRIKPEPKYRSFANAEECWQEMLKHQPFGWVKYKRDGHYVLVTSVLTDGKEVYIDIDDISGLDLYTVFDYYTFADGTPFGMKEEEE